MKVLLIYPYFLEERIHAEEISVPPLGVFYVGAALKENGHEVEILNWHDIHRTPEKIPEVLTALRPDVIGFSILHANRWGGIEIAAVARQLNPAVKIVFGGIGAAYLWEHLLKHFPNIDYVVIGEGEQALVNLLDCLEKDAADEIEQIGGIAFRKGGMPRRTECEPPIRDLDGLPNPARYFDFQHLALTRGCPGNCTFCGSPDFWGRRVRFHSAAYFVDQLEMLHRRGIAHFFISDDTFTVNKKRTIAVCNEIIRRELPIQWQAISRVDMIDEEILCWMRKAGCMQISYGVESGSKKIRRILKKNYTDGQIENAFSSTLRYGILPRAYFIYGCPGESRRTIEETIALMERIKPLGAVFYILDIFPGTALYTDFKKRCNAGDDIWLNRIEDILYFETDPELSREQVMAFGKALRTAFYESLPGAVESIELIDRKDLYPFHADFLSRLAMTFHQGDYAGIELIENKPRIAGRLYEQALTFHPVQRAYLGLGILRQRQGDAHRSVEILLEGLRAFPRDEALSVCLGVSLMNLGRYARAIECFQPFEKSPQVLQYMAACFEATGQVDKAAAALRRLKRLQGVDGTG